MRPTALASSPRRSASTIVLAATKLSLASMDDSENGNIGIWTKMVASWHQMKVPGGTTLGSGFGLNGQPWSTVAQNSSFRPIRVAFSGLRTSGYVGMYGGVEGGSSASSLLASPVFLTEVMKHRCSRERTLGLTLGLGVLMRVREEITLTEPDPNPNPNANPKPEPKPETCRKTERVRCTTREPVNPKPMVREPRPPAPPVSPGVMAYLLRPKPRRR